MDETKSLTATIHDEIAFEIANRHEVFEHEKPWPHRVIKRWYPRGSAGKALEWFDEIAAEHPDATREELADMLTTRRDKELATHAKSWFTRSHLDGVIAIVRGSESG